jgi:hypothetical protein
VRNLFRSGRTYRNQSVVAVEQRVQPEVDFAKRPWGSRFCRIPIGGEARPDGQDTIARSYAADPAFQGSNPYAFLTGIRSPAMVGTTGS